MAQMSLLKPSSGCPRLPNQIFATALSGDGKTLAVGIGRQVQILDPAKLAPVGKAFPTIDTEQLALSANGDRLTVRHNNTLATYVLPGGKELTKEEVPDLSRIVPTPDGKLILVQGAYLVVREPAQGK
jgi:hypothetical protein